MSLFEDVQLAEQLARRARSRNRIDPRALARTWPYITTAAHTIATDLDLGQSEQLFGRAVAVGEAQHAANHRTNWPGPGPHDEDLTRIVNVLSRAAQESQTASLSAGQRDEVEQLLATTVWNSAALVETESLHHISDWQIANRAGDASHEQFARETAAISTSRERAHDVAHIASPGAFASRPTTPDTLGEALAAWDVTAHRALLTHRSTLALGVIAHNEEGIHQALSEQLGNVVAAGGLDPAIATRVIPAVQRTADSWYRSLEVMRDLQWGQDAIPPALYRAARDVQEAIRTTREITDQSERSGGFLDSVSSHLTAAASLAATSQELLTEDHLRASARAVNAFAIEHLPGLKHALAPVDDVARGTTIEIPREVRKVLAGPLEETAAHARQAMRASSSLDVSRRTEISNAPLPHLAAPPTPEITRVSAGPAI